jgi:hypothetical protein
MFASEPNGAMNARAARKGDKRRLLKRTHTHIYIYI